MFRNILSSSPYESLGYPAHISSKVTPERKASLLQRARRVQDNAREQEFRGRLSEQTPRTAIREFVEETPRAMLRDLATSQSQGQRVRVSNDPAHSLGSRRIITEDTQSSIRNATMVGTPNVDDASFHTGVGVGSDDEVDLGSWRSDADSWDSSASPGSVLGEERQAMRELDDEFKAQKATTQFSSVSPVLASFPRVSEEAPFSTGAWVGGVMSRAVAQADTEAQVRAAVGDMVDSVVQTDDDDAQVRATLDDVIGQVERDVLAPVGVESFPAFDDTRRVRAPIARRAAKAAGAVKARASADEERRADRGAVNKAVLAYTGRRDDERNRREHTARGIVGHARDREENDVSHQTAPSAVHMSGSERSDAESARAMAEQTQRQLGEIQKGVSSGAVGKNAVAVRAIANNTNDFPLAAQLFRDKRISVAQARDRAYMQDVERELKQSQMRQAADNVDRTKRYGSVKEPPRRFSRTKPDPQYAGLKMYVPPHTTNRPVFTNDASQWGYGHASLHGEGSALGHAGEALGVAGGLAAATGIGAAAGTPMAIAGGVLKGADIVGSDFLGWW